jgi:MEMO1 family protein
VNTSNTDTTLMTGRIATQIFSFHDRERKNQEQSTKMGSAQSGQISSSMDDTMSGTKRTLSCVPHYDCRNAKHAGSWYTDDKEQLIATLETFLSQVDVTQQIPQQTGHEKQTSFRSSNFLSKSLLRAIICPHAGYSYSGPTAAYSYQVLFQELIRPILHPTTVGSNDCRIRHIIVLHPSHHVPLRGKCAISGAQIIATPLGNLTVDATLRDELLRLSSDDKKYSFSIMTQEQDENEHSGEMQYPYIVHVLQQAEALFRTKQIASTIDQITVTPIMCGSLTTADEIAYGVLLSETLDRPSVLTIVSTDFCHWGRRFGYQPTVPNNQNRQQSTSTAVPIYQVIQELDRRGMDLIEAKEPGAFASYLRETNNTICGRHAIAVWLRSITTTKSQTGEVDRIKGESVDETDRRESITSTNVTNSSSFNQCTVQFIRYEQSSQSRRITDSSVSYAAGIATMPIGLENCKMFLS